MKTKPSINFHVEVKSDSAKKLSGTQKAKI
jgi:hypothetical protein